MDPKYGMRIHFGAVMYRVLFLVTVTLTSDLSSRKIVPRAYPILFMVGIPYLVYGYSLGSRSATYCFSVTFTLTSVLETPYPGHMFYMFIICG